MGRWFFLLPKSNQMLSTAHCRSFPADPFDSKTIYCWEARPLIRYNLSGLLKNQLILTKCPNSKIVAILDTTFSPSQLSPHPTISLSTVHSCGKNCSIRKSACVMHPPALAICLPHRYHYMSRWSSLLVKPNQMDHCRDFPADPFHRERNSTAKRHGYFLTAQNSVGSSKTFWYSHSLWPI